MADPFSVQPPAWLERVARPINAEKLGETLGMSLMSLSTAFERDPNAPADAGYLDSRKGINQGFYETQQNARDPQWRVKGQILANQVLEQKAQLAATAAIANEHQKETSAWMQDAPTLTPWITATPEQRRTMTAPEAKSKLGLTTLQKQSVADQTYFTRQDQMDNKLEQERLKAEHGAGITARVSDWNDAVAGASPDTFSQISSLKGNGRLPSGLPTPEAIALLNVDRRNRGMTDFGSKATEYLEKPGKMSPQEVIRAKNLQSQANHFQKIVENQNTDEPTRAAAQAKLDDLNRQIQGGSATTATAPDPMAGKIDVAQKELNHALATGKGVKDKTEALATLKREQALNNGYTVLKKGQQIDPSTAKIGSVFFIEATGQTKEIQNQAQLDELTKQFGSGSKQGAPASGTATPRPVIPGIATPESAFPATPQTGKGAGSAQRQTQELAANRQSRIAELTSQLKNANSRGHFMSRQEYSDKYDELAKLMAQ